MEQLRDFLALWFGPQDMQDDPATAVGELIAFNDAAPPGTRDGDVEVLVVENQGVWLWGRNEDGRYVERENEPGCAWQETGESTEEFWLHHAAFEALTRLPACRSATGVDAEAVSRIERTVRPLPCRSWSWPGDGHTLFQRGAAIVMLCRDGAGTWVVASAPTDVDLDWLDDLDLEWEESGTRPG